jgi:DHA1 family inner membrane transport protein
MTGPFPQRSLWALLFGNLVIGTGVLLPAGLLSGLMADYGVNAGRAGLVMTVGGLVVGLGAPLLAAITSQVDRRLLLTLALSLYVIGHAGAALSPDFTLHLGFRALTVTGAAIFTPQAAATVALLVPPDRRGSAIAFIFVGWSLAAVLGIPLGSLLGEWIGWRTTYFLMVGLSLAGVLAVWTVLPGGLRVAPLQLSSWVRVLTDLQLMLVLAVTMAGMAGQFVLFTYISPVLREDYGLGAEAAALVFLLGGAVGIAGNIAASRLAEAFGVERGILLALALVAAGLGLIGVGWGTYAAFLAGVCLWNLGGFAVNSLQQGRLVALAPPLASATVALNTSFVYFGQSAGSAAGGWLIADGAGPALAAAGVAFVVVAMALSALAQRMGRTGPQGI